MTRSALRLRALLSASASGGQSGAAPGRQRPGILTVDMPGPGGMFMSGRTDAAVTFSRPVTAAAPRTDGGGPGDPAPDSPAAETVTSRDVSGLAVPWHTVTQRFGVDVVFTPETLRVPDDYSAVKLLVQHDDERPIGWGADFASTDAGLRGTYTVPLEVERVAEAIADMDARLRDGLSVGVELDAETIDAIFERVFFGGPDDPADAEPIPLAGVLRETSLVSVPQFLAARVDAAAPLLTFGRETVMPPAATTPAAALPAPATPGTILSRPHP